MFHTSKLQPGVKYIVESLQRVLGLGQGLIPVGAWKTSKGKDPGGILIRCSNHQPLLSTQQRLETLPGRLSFSARYLNNSTQATESRWTIK